MFYAFKPITIERLKVHKDYMHNCAVGFLRQLTQISKIKIKSENIVLNAPTTIVVYINMFFLCLFSVYFQIVIRERRCHDRLTTTCTISAHHL